MEVTKLSKFKGSEYDEFPSVKKAAMSNFKQQNMKAWRPLPTYKCSIIFFAVLSTISSIIGALISCTPFNRLLQNHIRIDHQL